jgi:hypothetical protein
VTARLTIRRVRCTWRVPPGVPGPTGGQARALVAGRLADNAGRLGDNGGLDADGDGVLVLRRLSVRVRVPAAGGPPAGDRLASLLAAAIGEGVRRTIQEPAARVARFRSWGEYTAAFVDAVLTGAAGTGWPFGTFAAPASRPAAVAAALRHRPAALADTLAALGRRGRLADALAMLDRADAAELLEELAAVATPGPATSAAQAALAAAVAAGGLPTDPAVLALWVAAGLAGQDVLTTGAVVLAAYVADALARPGTTTGRLTPLPPVNPGALAQELTAVLVAAGPPVDPAMAAPSGMLTTTFGGVLLLVPLLAERPGLAGPAVQPGADDAEPVVATAVLRWLTLLACLGPEAHAPAQLDQAIALLAGLAAAPSPSRLAAVAAAIAAGPTGHGPVDPLPHHGLEDAADELDIGSLVAKDTVRRLVAQLAGQVMAAFARRLPGFSDSSLRYLRNNFLVGPATVRWDAAGVRADLPAVPLAVVLRMAGTTHRRWDIAWLPGGVLELEGAGL